MQNPVIDIGNRSNSRTKLSSMIIPKIIVTSDNTDEVQEQSKFCDFKDFPKLSVEEIILGLCLVLTFVFLKHVFYVVEHLWVKRNNKMSKSSKSSAKSGISLQSQWDMQQSAKKRQQKKKKKTPKKREVVTDLTCYPTYEKYKMP